MLNICKEKVQVCAGKACTTTSILPCSSLTKLWFYFKAAICPAKWPTPRIKERCSWEEIIIWLSFWPMMRKSSVMWNFWAFSSFKEKEDAYLSLPSLLCATWNADMKGGALAATWQLFTEDGGAERQEPGTLWSHPTRAWLSTTGLQVKSTFVKAAIIWRFFITRKLNPSYAFLKSSGKADFSLRWENAFLIKQSPPHVKFWGLGILE